MIHLVPERLRSPMALRVLGTVAIGFLLLLVLVEVGGELAMGELRAFDRWLLRALRSSTDVTDPIGPRWFEEMARDVTALGGTAILTIVVSIANGYLLLKARWRTAVFLSGAVLLGLAVMHTLKQVFGRARPDLVPHVQYVYSNSFPSGHAMASALTYLTLAALLARVETGRRVQVFLLGAALWVTALVGMSRVYLGVHYPTDVLGGWGAGAAWAVLCYIVVDYLTERGWLDA